jgi:hypothetical protein
MEKLVAIDFACNDPDNGLFAGRVCFAQIDGNDVETRHGSDVTFTELPTGFRIHRKKFAAADTKHWVGNWCWNRYWLTVKEANRLVEHLRANGWACTCGDERFYDRFNAEPRP